MSVSKFQKLSRTLTEQGHGKHIILIQEDEEMIAYCDEMYFRQQDLKDVFLHLANVIGKSIESQTAPERD